MSHRPPNIAIHCVKIIHIYQEKIGGELIMQMQYLYDKINGFKQKNQNYIGRFLQKSTRWQRPWTKMHQTPFRKTNFLSTATLRFIPRMVDFKGERDSLQQNGLQGQNQFWCIVSKTCCNFLMEFVSSFFL